MRWVDLLIDDCALIKLTISQVKITIDLIASPKVCDIEYESMFSASILKLLISSNAFACPWPMEKPHDWLNWKFRAN